MLKKICQKCGKEYDAGSICSCQAGKRKEYVKDAKVRYESYQKKAYRNYDERNPNRHEKYNSPEWKSTRQVVLAYAHGIDEWIYATEHRIIPADTVHHIIPIEDDESLWLDLNNLIAIDAETHSKIHRLYNNYKTKKQTQQKLQEIVQKRMRGRRER